MKKIKLNEIKIDSFVTSNQKDVKGGLGSKGSKGTGLACSWGTCGCIII